MQPRDGDGVRALLPSANGHLKPPEREKVRKDISLEAAEGGWRCQHLDSRPVAWLTTKEYISVVLSHPFCSILVQQPQETGPGTLGGR